MPVDKFSCPFSGGARCMHCVLPSTTEIYRHKTIIVNIFSQISKMLAGMMKTMKTKACCSTPECTGIRGRILDIQRDYGWQKLY